MQRELQLGVIFGGRSVEHDVSIITGLQVLEALSLRHKPVPIYISRSGSWHTGEGVGEIASYRASGAPPGEHVRFELESHALLSVESKGSLLRKRGSQPITLDAVVLATHGTEGEDGCLQGLMELAGIPYVGPSVSAAATAMDKVLTKAVLRAADLPVTDFTVLRREAFERDPQAAQASVLERVALPFYVKPASLGSSVGVSHCRDRSQLQEALTLCFELDRVCLIEPAIEGGIEVNCAVLGRPGQRPRASVCEQPLASEAFLSFEDKYVGEGKGAGSKSDTASKGARAGMQSARRIIPAPIDEPTRARVQQLACAAFEAFGCAGVSRIDFLLDGDHKIYVNECNTIPGSFSFYLWEASGMPFVELLDTLIEIAFAERQERERTTRVFETSLLAEAMKGKG